MSRRAMMQAAGIVDVIKEMARILHPGDFSTQRYVVEQQIEAFEWIEDYGHERVPSAELAAIKQRAEEEHPGDYSTQRYVIEQQVEAYLWLLDS